MGVQTSFGWRPDDEDDVSLVRPPPAAPKPAPVATAEPAATVPPLAPTTSLPFASKSDTSRKAAESMAAKAPNVAESVWRFALSRGWMGVTADEVADAMKGKASHNTIRPRLVALRFSGLLVRHPDKVTRPTWSGREADVWVAEPCDDFHGRYKEPPPRNREDEEAIVQAARTWVHAVGQAHEDDALRCLLDAAWAAYGQGTERPQRESAATCDEHEGR